MIIRADARQLPLSDACVQCVVTSPPYWGLRDYGSNEQMGLEQTPEQYVDNLVAVFREVKRVLRDDGVAWLNLGDSYAAQRGGTYQPAETLAGGRHGRMDNGDRVNRGRHDGYNPTRNASAIGLKHKDLVGIPWSVAFALQQPYYTGVIKREADRTWLAALMDGEGCMGIRRQRASGNRNPDWADSYIPYLSIKMSDRLPLDRAVEITGYGAVREQPFRVGDDDRKVRTVQTPYVWRIDGNKAVQIARELYPYLLVKGPQAALLHTLDLSNKGRKRGRGNAVPADELAYREEIYTATKAFNQRATDVLPSWVITPPNMTEPGWYLRSDIIWAKPNPMPESVTDRPTRSHEYVFLLTKRAKYFYDAEAVKEPAACGKWPGIGPQHGTVRDRNEEYADMQSHPTRNKRDVWTMPTQPYRGAHFATMPPALAETCIKAGTSERGKCRICGAPWERVVERTGSTTREKLTCRGASGYAAAQPQNSQALDYAGGHGNNLRESITTGWTPTCGCDAGEPVPCVVLDPFSGAGTTGLVASRLGREYVGCDISQEYSRMAQDRIFQDAPPFAAEVTG